MTVSFCVTNLLNDTGDDRQANKFMHHGTNGVGATGWLTNLSCDKGRFNRVLLLSQSISYGRVQVLTLGSLLPFSSFLRFGPSSSFFYSIWYHNLLLDIDI